MWVVLAVTLSALPVAAATTPSATAPPEFISSLITDQRGDVVRIPVRLPNSNDARIRIVGQSTDYEAIVALSDGNHDERVFVEFNTYLAGTDEAFRAADTGDRVFVRSQTSVEGILPAGRYHLSTADAEDTAELVIEPRSTRDVTTMVAPDGAFEHLRSPDAVSGYRETGNLTLRPATERAAVARHDTLVLRVRASGLSGVLATQPGSNDTERFRSLVGSDVLSFTVAETNPPTSEERAHLLLNRTGVRVVADPGADRYFVVIDTSTVRYRRGDDGTVHTGLPLGFVFEANVTVAADGPLGQDTPRAAATTFEVVERSASLRTHAEAGQLFLHPAKDQLIDGTTTVAPGTTVAVRVAAPDADFDVTKSVTVGQSGGNGTVETAVDLASLPEGTTLSATASDDHGSLTAAPVAVTVESPAATLDEPSLVVEGSRLNAAVTANLSRGGVIAVRARNESGRLLGATAADPGERTVRVPLSNLPERDTPLVVVALRDFDSDGAVSPSVDAPYEQANAPRPVTVTVALYRLPPSPTPSPDGPPAQTVDSTDATPTGTAPTALQTTEPPAATSPPGGNGLPDVDGLPVDVPGFGAAAALTALSMVILLLARRE